MTRTPEDSWRLGLARKRADGSRYPEEAPDGTSSSEEPYEVAAESGCSPAAEAAAVAEGVHADGASLWRGPGYPRSHATLVGLASLRYPLSEGDQIAGAGSPREPGALGLLSPAFDLQTGNSGVNIVQEGL